MWWAGEGQRACAALGQSREFVACWGVPFRFAVRLHPAHAGDQAVLTVSTDLNPIYRRTWRVDFEVISRVFLV